MTARTRRKATPGEAEPNMDLIQCRSHRWAPWHIVCRHLHDDSLPAASWARMDLAGEETRQVDADWLCRTCFDRIQAVAKPRQEALFRTMMDEDLLRAACVYCITDLKRKAGFVERGTPGFLEQPVPYPPYGDSPLERPRIIVPSDRSVGQPTVTGQLPHIDVSGWWFLFTRTTGPVITLLHGTEAKFLAVFPTRDAALAFRDRLVAGGMLPASPPADTHQIEPGKGDLFIIAMNQCDGVRVMIDPKVHSPTHTTWAEAAVVDGRIVFRSGGGQ